MATRRSKRLRKVVTHEVLKEDSVNPVSEGQTETVPSSGRVVAAEEDVPIECASKKQEEENQDEQDSQMNTDIEVKGSVSTVTVSWAKKNEEGKLGEKQNKTDASQQMMGIVNGKRKTCSAAETSPSKKPKLINDGFCLFVGNLNNSKPLAEIKDSLANFFIKQSLLVQDIRLDRSKKHAFVDLASELDLTKALTLDGEKMFDKPMKIAKAKVKSEDKVKVKASAEEKKAAKDARCLFLKNVPYSATKQDILKIFPQAVAIRFPDGAEGPNKGIAFVEFKSKQVVRRVQRRGRVVTIQGRTLIVDSAGQKNVHKVAKADGDDNNNNNDTNAAAPPSNTLFVSKLSHKIKENHLKKVFEKAVSVDIPQSKGKSKGRFAFVKFATVADAEQALQSSQNATIGKRVIGVQFCKTRAESEKTKALSKTLIVMGLAERTTAETLKIAFEGALCSRVAVDKETGVSKRFGFVDFDSEENAKAVKEAMEDCEIDGSKVTVAYAKPMAEKGPLGARGGPAGRPAGQGAARGGGGSGGGKGRGAAAPQDAVKEVKSKA